MIEKIFIILSNALNGSIYSAVFAAFGWGVLSVMLSPCHLSGIPLIIGFLNTKVKGAVNRPFTLSLIFAIGILITIGAAGLITASLGRLIGDTGIYGNYFVAVILLIFGLYLMDIIALPWNGKLFNNGNRKGIYSALIMGILFGAGLGPCTFAFMAPVLGVVFQSANSDFYLSASLLLAFGAGHCSVIVAAGTFTKKLQIFMNWTEDSMVVIYIKRICGALVILGGIYMIYRSI